MTLRLMLDTDLVSYIAKGRPVEFRRQMSLLPASEICVSAVTRAEVFYGLVRFPDDHPLHLPTRRFFEMVVVLDWPASAAETFAEIKHDLISTGQRIGEMDLLIAAHALDAGLPLVTGNVRHHRRVPGLAVMDWREPESSS